MHSERLCSNLRQGKQHFWKNIICYNMQRPHKYNEKLTLLRVCLSRGTPAYIYSVPQLRCCVKQEQKTLKFLLRSSCLGTEMTNCLEHLPQFNRLRLPSSVNCRVNSIKNKHNPWLYLHFTHKPKALSMSELN